MARFSPLAARNGGHNSAAVLALVAAIAAAASAVAAADAGLRIPNSFSVTDNADSVVMSDTFAAAPSPSSGAKDASGSEQVDPSFFFPKPLKPTAFNGVCPTETISVLAALNTTTCGTGTTSPDTPAGALSPFSFTTFANGTFERTTSGVTASLRVSQVVTGLDNVIYWRWSVRAKCPEGWSYVTIGILPDASGDEEQTGGPLLTPNGISAFGPQSTRNPPDEFFAKGFVGLRRVGETSPTTCDIYNNDFFLYLQIVCCKQVP